MLGRSRAAAELGRRLAADGHDVVLAGPPANEDAACAAGLVFAALPDFPLGGPVPGRGAGLADRLPAGRRRRLAHGVDALDTGPVRALLGARRPDLVLIDGELHPHIIVALGLGLRVALFTTMFLGPPGLRAPPLDSRIVPGRGLAGTGAGIGAAWARTWLRAERRRARDHVQGAAYRSVLAAAASAEGLDLRRATTIRRWQVPFAWRRLPQLVLQARELDLPRPAAARLRHLGPMLPPERPDVVPREGDAPVVYVAFGSRMAPARGFVAQLWAAARRLDGWRFVQSAGRSAAGLPPDPPPNLRLVDWAPQRALLAGADVAVIHAGVNSLAECVDAAVPMLCRPLGLDQPGNAARVIYHGLGLVADPAATAEGLAGALERLVGDPGIARRVAAMRAVSARYRDDRVAERAIEALLRDEP